MNARLGLPQTPIRKRRRSAEEDQPGDNLECPQQQARYPSGWESEEGTRHLRRSGQPGCGEQPVSQVEDRWEGSGSQGDSSTADSSQFGSSDDFGIVQR